MPGCHFKLWGNTRVLHLLTRSVVRGGGGGGRLGEGEGGGRAPVVSWYPGTKTLMPFYPGKSIASAAQRLSIACSTHGPSTNGNS